MKNLLLLCLLSVLSLSCENKTHLGSDKEMIPIEKNNGMGNGAASLSHSVVTTIEKAHNKTDFLSHEAISFKIDLKFGGNERINGNLTLLTNTGKIRIDKSDGSSLIFDGTSAYLTPANANQKGNRFDIFTWAYFFAMPFKLSDDGVNIKVLQETQFDGKRRQTLNMTFQKGTGDSPDDWYMLYINADNTLHAAGYVVTFQSDLASAEKSPHAIVYSAYQNIEGVPIATNWKFYNYDKQLGLVGDPLGEATISDIHFVHPEADFFSKPKDYAPVK